MKIAVVGSQPLDETHGDEAAASEAARFEKACREIGQAVVASKHALLIASLKPKTADGLAVRGAADASEGLFDVVYYMPSSETGKTHGFEFPAHANVTRRPVPDTVVHLKAIDEADAIIAVGGARGTFTAIQCALALKKPVIALPDFGGSTKEAFPTILAHYGDARSDTLANVSGPWRAGAAISVVAVVEKLAAESLRSTPPVSALAVGMTINGNKIVQLVNRNKRLAVCIAVDPFGAAGLRYYSDDDLSQEQRCVVRDFNDTYSLLRAFGSGYVSHLEELGNSLFNDLEEERTVALKKSRTKLQSHAIYRLSSLYRIGTTVSAAAVAAMAISIGLQRWSFGEWDAIPWTLALGGVGTLLWTLLTAGTRTFMNGLMSPRYVVVDGAARGVAGALAGFGALLAARSGWAFGPIADNTPAMCLVAFVAGLSPHVVIDRLVDNVRNRGRSESPSPSDTTTDGPSDA